MCFNWQKMDDFLNRPELTLEEINKISKGLKSLLYLTVSGGEPTLRDDLPRIVKIFTQRNKVQFVTIPTNGLMPSRIAALLERTFYENPRVSFRVPLPLDGIGQLHNEIRGVADNFQRFLETHDRLNRLKDKYKNFDLDV